MLKDFCNIPFLSPYFFSKSIVCWDFVIGILFITNFDITTLSKTDWLGILSGATAGLAYTSIRELRNYYDTRAIVFSFMFKTASCIKLSIANFCIFLLVKSLVWSLANSK